MKKNTIFKISIWLTLFFAFIYGAGRLYFYATAGFTVANISSEIKYDPRFSIEIEGQEKELVDSVLSQNFYYLGRGCQSYVFASQDGKYVIKFFKYQHFTPKEWLKLFLFIPAVEEFYTKKLEEKNNNRHVFFSSLKLAFDELKTETALVYIHLNKTDDLKKEIIIFDKMGFRHVLNADQFEFIIQKRANMLEETIVQKMSDNKTEEVKTLLDHLFDMLVLEYSKGIGDNDHALMQNTGVFEERPVHIDIGQFVRNENFKNEETRAQEMFNKTYRFRIWLKIHYPDIAGYFDEKLYSYIGPRMDELTLQSKNMAAEEY